MIMYAIVSYVSWVFKSEILTVPQWTTTLPAASMWTTGVIRNYDCGIGQEVLEQRPRTGRRSNTAHHCSIMLDQVPFRYHKMSLYFLYYFKNQCIIGVECLCLFENKYRISLILLINEAKINCQSCQPACSE